MVKGGGRKVARALVVLGLAPGMVAVEVAQSQYQQTPYTTVRGWVFRTVESPVCDPRTNRHRCRFRQAGVVIDVQAVDGRLWGPRVIHSNAAGRFSVSLRTGRYRFAPRHRDAIERPYPRRITVRGSNPRKLNLYIDSGAR